MAVVAILLPLIGCGGAGPVENDDLGPPVHVVVATVGISTLHPSTDAMGQIVPIPEQSAVIVAQQSGVVSQVLIVEGDWVKQDQVIAELDTRIITAERNKAQATLEAVNANLLQYEHGTRIEEIATAKDLYSQAAADIAAKRAKVDALKPLIARGELSEVRIQQAKSELEAAQANAEANRSRLELLEAGTREESIAEARARAREAEAELQIRQLALDMCSIRSPIDGTITSLPIRLGAKLDAQATVASVVNTTDLFVQVRIPAANVSSLDKDRSAEVWVADQSESPIEGVFERAAGAADPSTGDISVFLKVANPDGALKIGMACRARIFLAPAPDVITVPITAISDSGGTSVVTIVRDEKAYEVPVTIGVRTDEYVQVLDGLEVGDLVTVENGYSLPEGYPVVFSL